MESIIRLIKPAEEADSRGAVLIAAIVKPCDPSELLTGSRVISFVEPWLYDPAFAELLDTIRRGGTHTEPAAISSSQLMTSPLAPTQQVEQSIHPQTAALRVFVSHSSGDNAFGYELADRLRAQGMDVWYDSHGSVDTHEEWQGGIPPAAYWQTDIVRELTTRPVFILILTEKSVASKWVQDEISLAWSEKNSTDVTKGKIIVPVLRETCAVPPLVSLVQYVDYRPTVDHEIGWRDLLLAVRSRGTRPAKGIELGPPFDLGLLPSLERFVGREEAVQQIIQLLTSNDDGASEGSIASIAAANGLAGIGKTALATEVVRRLMTSPTFIDGIAVVSCKGESDPAKLLRLILARFTAGRREPDDETVPALADRARLMLAGKHVLVVLDNVEQGWPLRDVLGPLRTAGVSLLLTSRAQMPAVPLEASVKLDALPLNEALDVFAEYYGRGTALDLTRLENDAATRIVKALGRHTLAIKLVAANAATLNRPLSTLAQELSESPQRGLLLENGEEAVRYVLESSYEALPSEAQRLFTALAAFATGDVGRQAILALAEQLEQENGERSLRQLIELRFADTALLEKMPENADSERIRFHSLVQAYARNLLRMADGGERYSAQHAVALWYLYYTNQVAKIALTPDEMNINGALEWAYEEKELDILMQFCLALTSYWIDMGRVRAGATYLPWGIEAAKSQAAATEQPEYTAVVTTLVISYGRILQDIGRLIEAAQLYEQQLELVQDGDDQSVKATLLNNLGMIALQRGQVIEAERYFRESLPLLREIENRSMEATVLNNLGLLAYQRGQLVEAQAFFEQVLPILGEIENRSMEATVRNNLGLIALQRGQVTEAQTFFEQALPILREVENRSMEATVLTNLGQVAFQRGQLAEAQAFLEQALPILREVENRSVEATVLSNLGQIAFQRGQLVEGQTFFEQALPILREIENRPMEATVLSNLGQVAFQRGQVVEGQTFFEQALLILRETENRSMEATVLSGLGQVAFQRGQLVEAQTFYEQALLILREVENRSMEATVLSGLGLLASARGQVAEAEQYLRESLPILREVENRSGEATALSGLGILAYQRGHLAEAQAFFEQALPILHEVESRSGEAAVLSNLGQVASARGQVAEAEQYLRESLPILREVENRSGEATVLNNLGLLAFQRGRLAEAQTFYEQALPILREVENRSMEATVLNNLGLLASQRGRLAEAQAFYEQALPILQEVENRSVEATVLSNLGQVALQRGQLAEAQAFLERALPIMREVENRSMEGTVLNNSARSSFNTVSWLRRRPSLSRRCRSCVRSKTARGKRPSSTISARSPFNTAR